jgi:hypothetical protein
MISIFSPSPIALSLGGRGQSAPVMEESLPGEGGNHANENTSVEQLYMDKENYYP